MKKFWQYLVNHLKQNFHFGRYAGITVFISVCIALNYYFDFEDSYIDKHNGIIKFLLFLLTHAFVYFIPVIILQAGHPKNIKLTKEFWTISILGIVLLSADRSLLFTEHLVSKFFHSQVYILAYKVVNNLAGVFYTLVPLYFLYHFKRDKSTNFYGLGQLPADIRPYFLLLVIMAPVLMLASSSAGFQAQYPMYTSTTAHLYLQVPEWVTVALYELAYALNFITIEFFFRGFLVLGMTAYLGRSSLLPMACLYCSFHFGKPMPEAISSILGGYILGVIALETKSIWGGALVHIGIAWMMELAAWVQQSVKN